jgi:hypothetical protein
MKRGSGSPQEQAPDDDVVGHVIGVTGFVGAVLRFLGRSRLPAIALRGRSLYRVMLVGRGFELPLEPAGPNDHNPTGFYTTRVVAARSRLEAEALAKAGVVGDWQGSSLLSHFTGVEEPTLTISESVAMDGWFEFHTKSGFAFFSATGDPAAE